MWGLASNGTVLQTKLQFFPSFFLTGVQFLGNFQSNKSYYRSSKTETMQVHKLIAMNMCANTHRQCQAMMAWLQFLFKISYVQHHMLLLCKGWHTQTNSYTWIMPSSCLHGAFSEDTGHALNVACRSRALRYSLTGIQAMPCLRWLVNILSPQWVMFNTRPIHEGSVLGQVFLWIYWFSPCNYHTTNDHSSIKDTIYP
jgi:hypothetical protein